MKAERWVPRPSFHPLLIGSLGFKKKQTIYRCRGPNAKLHVFLPHIFSVFIIFLKYGEKSLPNFCYTYRVWQGLSTSIFYFFLSLSLSTIGLIEWSTFTIIFAVFLIIIIDHHYYRRFLIFFDWFGCKHGWWAQSVKFCAFSYEKWCNFARLTMISKLCFFAHYKILVKYSVCSKIKKRYIFRLSFLCWSRIKCQKLEIMFKNHQFSKE